jgi:hypothetical protein
MHFSRFFLLILLVIAGCDQLPEEILPADASLLKVFDLPDILSESSGMIFYDSLLWTFNDSRSGAQLYGLGITSGDIRKQITVSNAVNVDWEDIAQDSLFIYIGDIGNGSGSRTSLTVYKLRKSAILDLPEQNCLADSINFSFEDQTDFTAHYHETQFDCEALICVNDSLYVFTKDWVGNHSVLYNVPNIPGNYMAKRIDEFDSDGLVTGASYIPGNKQIILCGYRNYRPFIILFESSDAVIISLLTQTRYDFSEYIGLQTEGIDSYRQYIYLTCENSLLPQGFFKLKVN